jgi:alpha-amylase
MRSLNHAGMVRNNQGNSLPGTSVVTFVDNHDTGKEHDKWLTQDWDMAYAYILFAEGRPTVFYPHFYGVTQVDAHNSSYTVTAPSSLQDDIKKMIHVRKTYLGGTMMVPSDTGNPYPSGDAADVYVARRQGNGTKTGAILVLNNHASQTKGLWVDNAASGYTNWANATLVNALTGSGTTQVYSDGRVYVSAPPRGFAVYVPQSEYVAYSPSIQSDAGDGLSAHPGVLTSGETPARFSVEANYPNPFNPSTQITFTIPESGMVHVRVYNVLGQEVATLVDGPLSVGKQTVQFNARSLPSGIYYYTVAWNGHSTTRNMLLLK